MLGVSVPDGERRLSQLLPEGCHVLATASQGSTGLLRELGVTEIIDYKSVRLDHAVRNIDVVFDGIGLDYIARSIRQRRLPGYAAGRDLQCNRLPNGASASTPSLRCCTANGIPMMVTARPTASTR
jgi:NADPH:quinone reductase-like Zn-dependent oxidoreductase